MLYSHISHIIIMLQTVFLCIISAYLGALCRSNILVRHKVVHDKNHLILIKDTFPLNLLPLSNRNRSRDVISMNQIHLCKNQLTAFHLLQSCVLCQNLLAHRHSHRTLLYLQHFSDNTAHNYPEKNVFSSSFFFSEQDILRNVHNIFISNEISHDLRTILVMNFRKHLDCFLYILAKVLL